tara:strand:+ start:487 stop:1074 length:588 start_codon:yes stop_codon:yes gene_type:complete
MSIKQTNAGNNITEIGSFITLAKEIDPLFGFKLLNGAELNVSGTSAGYTVAATYEITPSGGTYNGDANFLVTMSGGAVTKIAVVGGSAVESASLVGETVVFDEATLQASFGGGTGSATGTVASADETEVTEVALGGNPNNGMGLYVGTGGEVQVKLKGMSSFISFKNIQNGEFLPILAIAIKKVSGGATNLVAFI